MKAQILKIAGVKNDAEFYKKYPTEEAFMKKHGAKLQKAFAGFDSSSVTGSTGAFSSANMKMAGSDLLQGAGSIMGTISSIAEKKKLRDEMERGVQLSNLVSQAAAGRDKIKRRYVRPEDTIIQPGQLGKPYGEGTNYLAAENGAEIANTFAPNTIYTDLGYEPLHDTNVKQFQGGGSMPGIDPTFGLAGSLGGGLGSLIGGGDFEGSEESQLGSTIGGAIGTAILPGVGTAIGAGLGGLAGGYFGGQHKADILKKKNAMQSNLLNAAFQNNDQFDDYGKNGTTVPSYEEGGWVSNDWMPQVITTFGEHKMSHLLQPPHDADMLRAGGHLKEYTPPSAEAMYTGRDLPYQMEHGGQMAMGGDLQVHRGEAETLSYNPFLPDGGETVMFRGPSHDNGGMPISFGNNGVEVEGGEPAVKLQDGGSPDGNLVVYGNMIIPNYGVTEIGDPNAKGKKFKNYINDLSKVEARQNKIVEKNTNNVNDLNVLDTFDKFSLQSSQANILGANMKLKDIAAKKLDTAAVQNAILDTAKEHGLVSDDLAKGKIKAAKANDPYAKFGGKLTMAQNGLNATKFYEAQQAQQNMMNNWPGEPIINTIETPPIPLDYTQGYQQIQSDQDLAGGWPRAADSKQSIAGLLDLLKAKGIDTTISSGTRAGAKTKQGKPSRHAIGEAVDVKFPALGKDAYQLMLEDKDIARYALTNNLTLINEYDPNVAKKTGATGGHVHIGLDKGTATSDAFRKQAAALHPTIAAAIKGTPATSAAPVTPATPATATATNAPGLPQLAGPQVNYLKDLYSKAEKSGKGPDVLKFQQEFHKIAPDYAKSVIGKSPVTAFGKSKGYDVTDLRGNEDSRFGERTKQYMSALLQNQTVPKELADRKIAPMSTGNLSTLPIVGQPKTEVSPVAASTDYWGEAMTAASSLIPYLRPSNQQPLDPNQLLEEQFALSQNQIEPVQAQLYNPQLGTPYDISLQDQLNANQADFNAMQRQVGYNPEALATLATLAAQKYAANSSVLGNQFRMNQAEKAQVYGENRNLLNQAQLQNIGALDVQAQRQSKAKSNTKEQAQAALNSISDKIAKNKLENKTLGVYENMYNYRFGPDGKAYNVNAPQQWNPSGNASATTSKNASGVMQDAQGNTLLPEYNDDGTIKTYKVQKSAKRNGAIVKAIKNL